MLSQAVEDYLKAVFEVQRDHGKVATTVLAERMGVAPASATGMIKKLANLKLVRHNPYQGVVLTRAGEKVALEVLRHHRLLELYLAEARVMDRCDDEATAWHVISEELRQDLARRSAGPRSSR
jgi:DtxR family Mn-dependent transcriptional regulator